MNGKVKQRDDQGIVQLDCDEDELHVDGGETDRHT